MPVLYNKWQIAAVDNEKAESLSKKLKLPKSITSILINRDLVEENKILEFLHPKLSHLPSPDTMKGLDTATDLISAARRSNQKIGIFGDYDVDGVTSTALLVTFLKDIGFNVKYYHSDRLTGGYGLNKEVVEKISDECPDGLMITVDCGISEQDNVQLARELGLSVIVTDHHLPPEILPPANAIINPLQSGCNFEFKHLAGVGLAFYLVVAIRSRLREEGVLTIKTQPNLKNLLDLVALGSVADMVPLSGVNRILVKAGLELINKRKNNRKGITSLLNVCGLSNQDIIANDIGYKIGPRINAAGRIGDANLATNLLVCNNHNKAFELSMELNNINEKRKKMAEELFVTAVSMADSYVKQGCNVLVLHGEDWHHGLLGIIASRIVEQFQKPTIILGGSEIAKGSARTVSTIDIYQTIKSCEDLIVQFGGHRQAAGLTIEVDKIEPFRLKMEEIVVSQGGVSEENKLLIDQLLGENCVFNTYFEKYSQLEPFGTGNLEPKFSLTEPCCLRNIQVVGKKKDHLRFSVKVCSEVIEGIGFNFGHLAAKLTGQKVNIAFSIRDNWFRGIKKPQIFLHDINMDGTN